MSEKNIYDYLENQRFDTGTNAAEFQENEFDIDEYKRRKTEEKQMVYGLIDAGTEKLKESSSALEQYLTMQQHFDRYTVNNVIAIMEQKADARQLRDFDSWKAQRARLKKGASHVKILEPYNYVTPDGHTGVGYNIKKVYDVSDTTARPTVRFRQVQDKRMLLKALVYRPQARMEVIDDMGDYGGGALFDPDSNTVFIRRGLGQETFFRNVARELAYADLSAHNPEMGREDLNFHAECTAYMLCKKYGIEPEGVEPVMPDGMKTMELRELRGEFSKMREAMIEINGRMAESLERQRQEKARQAGDERGNAR